MANFPLLTESTPFDGVILADGDYPRHPLAKSYLHRAPYICCCDGAGARLIVHGCIPDAIVGDGDSLTDDFLQSHADIVHLEEEQDDNDLTKATRHCLALGLRRLIYLGTTGKREDHTLGNISLLARYTLEMGIDAVLMTDYGYFVAATGINSFGTFAHQQISIFNLGCSRLTGKGLKWEPYCYSNLWQGTLNEALGNEVIIEGDAQYLIFRTFDAK